MEKNNCTFSTTSCSSSTSKKFSLATYLTRMLVSIFLLVGFTMATTTVRAQNDFKQASNNNGLGLGKVLWINSIVQQNNSKYYEGMSVPQRIIFLNIAGTPGNNHSLKLSHQSIKAASSSHAYDFLTSWPQAVTAAGVYTTSVNLLNEMNECGPQPGSDPTGFLSACASVHSGPHFLDVNIPDGQLGFTLGHNVDSKVAAYESIFGNRTLRIWGNAPITAGAINFINYTGGDLDANYELTWTSAATTIVVEVAGHLAVGVDPFFPAIGYGAPNLGAGAISGGPHHFNLYTLDGASLGSQDNQIKGSDILQIPAASCDIGGPFVTCESTNLVVFTGQVDNAGSNPTYQFVLSANTANAVISGSSSGAYTGPVNLNVVPGSGGFTANGSVTVTFNVYQNGILITNCSKTLSINPLPVANGVNIFKCDEGGGQANFNLSLQDAVINNGTSNPVDWFLNPQLTIPVPDPTSLTASNGTLVYARVTNTATGCVNVAPVTLIVSALPACNISGVNATCAGTTGLVFSAGAGAANYAWSVTGGTITGGQGSDQITVTAGGAGTLAISLSVTSNNNCVNQCTKNVTINALPACTITGNNNVCPGSTNTYSGPAGMASYEWSISGNATISGATNGPTVSVVAGARCGIYTLSLTVINNGCTSTCSQQFAAADAENPVITLAAASPVPCNPTQDQINAAFGGATVTDNCSSGLQASGSVGSESGTGCTRTVTKSWTVTDACNNVGTASQTITFTRDVTNPVITLAAASPVPCNPTQDQINAAFGGATVTDNCSSGLQASGSVGSESGTGCTRTVTKSWTVTDACNNVGTASQTITFTRDVTNPVITLAAASPVPCNPTQDQINAAFGGATVTDNCSSGLQASGSVGSESGTGCTRTVTKSWTVTDACNNVGTASQTITFTRDVTNPVITLAAASPVPCNPTQDQINAAFGGATVTDNCSSGLQASGSVGSESGTGCTRTVTKSWTVTDACNNVGTASQTITFTRDVTNPVITLAAASPVPCNPTQDQINAAFGGATVTDNCSSGLQASGSVGSESGTGCTRTVTKSWTVTDACNNVGTASQTITFTRDVTNPVITLAAASPVPCNPTQDQINAAFGGATVTDNCSSGLQASGSVGSESGTGCTRTVTKSWTVTDACNNVGTASQTITFTRDVTNPVITLAAASPVPCNPTQDQINAAFGGATVTDNCSSGLQASGSVGSESGTGCTRTVTKSWTVTDACNNVGTASQTITFTRDVTNPVITLAAASPVPCNPTQDQINAAFGGATVTDNCSSGLQASGSVGSESGTGCTRTVTKSWTVTDACNNVGTASQTITFTRDVTNPVITLAAASPVPCNPTQDQINAAFGGATVTDNCSSGLQASGSVGSESGTGCTRTVTKSWTVTDACNNVGTASQTITFTRDVTNPVITLAAASPVPCNPTQDQINAAFGGATVTDNCSSGLQASGSVGSESGTGCTRTVTKSWTVTDACNNVGTASQTITFTRDVTNPVITLAAASPVPCNPTQDQINAAFGGATVTDNCSSGLQASGSVGSESGTGCTRTVTKSWTVTDACNNVGTASQTITFTRDVTNPVITLAAASPVPCNPTQDQINAAFGGATVTDNCSSGLQASGSVGSESGTGCTRTVTKSWTVTDACNNVGTASQTITFTRDVTNPVITLAAASPVPCNPTQDQINAAFGGATVTDNCSSGLQASGSVGSESGTGCTRTVTKSWTVTDACNNVGTASQTITFTRDVTNPVITLAAASPVPCNPTQDQINAAFGGATVTDNCSSGLQASGSVGSESGTGCTRTVTKSWTVTDACNNVGTASQTITFTRDVTNPVITLAAASPVPCNPTQDQINAAFGGATVTDNCSSGLQASGSVGSESGTGCTRTVTKSWTVTDACNNVGTASQTITFTRDVTGPVLSNQPPATIEAQCGTLFNNLPWQAPTWSDNCGGTVTIVSIVTTPDHQVDCPGVYTRVWTVRDACNNTSSFTQTINVPCCHACTYTQGAYGNPGGSHCNGDGTSTSSLTQMQSALTRAGGSYTFGNVANNRYFRLNHSDAQQVFRMLPGGGNSQPFGVRVGGATFSNTASWSVVPLQQGVGKIRNTLFAQTMTMFFNLYLTNTSLTTLGNISLSDTMITMQSSSCNVGGVPVGIPDTFGLPHNVIVYMANPANGYANNIAGLFRLANDVLGGANTAVSAASVAQAVDVLNNAFDECRFLTGRLPYVPPVGSKGLNVDAESPQKAKVEVTAHPNPYTDKVVFTISSEISGQSSFDLFGLLGEKVTKLYDGYIDKNTVKTLTYETPVLGRKTMIYRLRIGNEVVTGKVLYVN